MSTGTLASPHTIVRPRSHRARLGMTDWVAVLLVVLLVTNLPTPGFMPFTPILLLAPLLAVLTRRNLAVWLPRLLVEPAVVLVCIIWLASSFIDGIAAGGGEVVGYLGRATSNVIAYVTLIAYAASHHQRFTRLWWVFVVFLVVSLLWYALEVLKVEPFQNWRLLIFAGRGAVENMSTSRYYGLATSLAVYGYQLSALLPIAVGLSLYPPQRRVRRFFLAITVLALVLTEYSTQRSALLGGILGIMLLVLFYRQPDVPYRRMIIYAGWAAALAFLLVGKGILNSPYAGGSVSEKFTNSDDVGWRLGMQAEAIRMIFLYPAGELLSGVSWEEVGLPAVRERFPRIYISDVAVHNGYLTRSVRFGVLYFIAVVWFLLRLCWLCLRLWRRPAVLAGALRLPLTLTIAATVSTAYVQAMFHNASVVTDEGVSVLLVVFVVAGFLSTKPVTSIRSRPLQRSLQYTNQVRDS